MGGIHQRNVPETYLATAGTVCKAGIGCTGPGDCDTGRCRNGVCATCSVSAYCSETQANPCTCNTATGQCIAESESRWIVLDGHSGWGLSRWLRRL